MAICIYDTSLAVSYFKRNSGEISDLFQHFPYMHEREREREREIEKERREAEIITMERGRGSMTGERGGDFLGEGKRRDLGK